MTSSLKFILGDRGLLNSRIRQTAEDHSPIKARLGAKGRKKKTTYVKSHGLVVPNLLGGCRLSNILQKVLRDYYFNCVDANIKEKIHLIHILPSE